MTLTFLNQPLKSAVVPLMVGNFPTRVWRGDGTWSEVRQGEGADERRRWWWVWGLYWFRDADNHDAPTVIEARMLIGQHIHDFCGGVLSSSGGSIVHNRFDNPWSQPRLGTLGASNVLESAYLRANVPCLHDALRLDRSITSGEARAIMDRSLMLWTLARLDEYGKRGLFGFDRATERTKHRNVLRRAADLTAIPNFTYSPVYGPQEALVNTRILPSAPDAVEELLSPAHMSAYQHGSVRPATITVHEGPPYRNRNSGSMVGLIAVQFQREGDSGDEDDLDVDEEWDEELGEYVETVRYRNVTPVETPEYWKLAMRTPAYVAQQPVGMWNNG